MAESISTPPSIWGSIVTVFRQNRLPCLLLNVLVVSLVSSYYCWPGVAGWWQAVGDFKLRWSYGFSLVSTVFSAALLPVMIQWAMGTLPPGRRWRRLLWLVLFWGYRGMEIDLLYHVQAWLFGPGNDAATLLKKLLVDQFVYTPFWAVPTYTIALRWVSLDSSWEKTRASLDRVFWTRTCPTILLTNWLVWIPAVVLVYSLPVPLQFPLFSVVMCFFVLMVTLLARDQAEP